MSDDSIIKGLERRITKLENAKNVVISVAAILAIFVATFFNKLTAAQSQIAELTSQASSLKPLVEDSVAKIQDAADIQIAKLAAVAGASGVPLSVGSQSDHAVGPAASMGDASGAANSEQMTAVSLVDVET